jgi:hypothetical protein
MIRLLLLRIASFLLLLFLLPACQEYIHDSFDTFSGQIVDQDGNHLPNFKLKVLRIPSEFANEVSDSQNLVYRLETDNQGKVRFILPSRNEGWYLESESDFIFEYELFDTILRNDYLQLLGSNRDENGMVDFGTVKAIPQ